VPLTVDFSLLTVGAQLKVSVLSPRRYQNDSSLEPSSPFFFCSVQSNRVLPFNPSLMVLRALENALYRNCTNPPEVWGPFGQRGFFPPSHSSRKVPPVPSFPPPQEDIEIPIIHRRLPPADGYFVPLSPMVPSFPQPARDKLLGGIPYERPGISDLRHFFSVTR